MQTNHQNITLLNVSRDWKANPRISVTSVGQLRKLLMDLSTKEPGTVNLESTAGDLLQLGIGGKFAFAQFTTNEDKPRYLCAKPEMIRAMEDVEFLCGDTPTPISPGLCISFEDALKIAEYFFEKGGRDSSFEWVEV